RGLAPGDARDEARALRDDRGASPALARQVLEERDAPGDVADDHVLQARSEQPRERLRELGRSFEPVGHEAHDAIVASADERLGPHADALETGVHLLESPVARALLRSLALALVERLFLELDEFFEFAEPLLEARLLGHRGHATGAEILDRSRQPVRARGVLDTSPVEQLFLPAEAVAPRRHLVSAPLEPGELRLGAGDVRLELRDHLTPLDHACVAARVNRGEPGEPRLFAGDARCLIGLLGLERGDLRGDHVALGPEARALLGHLAFLALGLLLALRERRQAVLRALDPGLLRLSRAVGGEARVLRRVEPLARAVHVEPRGLELGFASAELRTNARVVFGEPVDLAALQLDPAGEP